MLGKNKSNKIKATTIFSILAVFVAILLITVSVGSFSTIKSWFGLSVSIKQLNASYEPSAVQQLKNGRVVVLEDEVSRAFSLLEFDSDGNLLEDSIRDQHFNAQLKQSFDDLEGITLSAGGELYATTSFSRTSKGKQRANREKLVQIVFDEAGELKHKNVYTTFAEDLKKSKLFERLDELSDDDKIRISDINIEGLSFDKESRQLLFGLKQPLVNDLSVIFALKNPQQVLEGVEKPIISEEAILLDLQGGGIRSLFYDQKLQGYLIANEVNFGGGPKQSVLWFWGGDKTQNPVTLMLPEIENMENIEAISAVKVSGRERILLMSDDGSRKKKRGAHYILIDYEAIESQIGR